VGSNPSAGTKSNFGSDCGFEKDIARENLSQFDIPRNPKSAIRNPKFPWGVRQARFKPLDFQSRDAWVRIPHALPISGEC
jgi:hypothetical protein